VVLELGYQIAVGLSPVAAELLDKVLIFFFREGALFNG